MKTGSSTGYESNLKLIQYAFVANCNTDNHWQNSSNIVLHQLYSFLENENASPFHWVQNI